MNSSIPPYPAPAPTLGTLHNGKSGIVVWFTGLSGAGKTTLALAVAKQLQQQGLFCITLDGDVLRSGLSADLGFSLQDRSENVRRAAEVAKLCARAGAIVLAAFISPLRADRTRARSILTGFQFLEAYCACPLDICEKRDVKGLYKDARSGKKDNYTGIDSPYEEPLEPDLKLSTDTDSIEQCTLRVINSMQRVLMAHPPHPQCIDDTSIHIP